MDRQYMVVDAKAVAADPASLEEWLNVRAREGWVLVSADHGVLYLRNEGARVR